MISQNEFDVHTNTKITSVGKPLLSKDLEGKPPMKDWKYYTAIGMLTYLQGNTRPEISMSTHRLPKFCQEPRSYEQATTHLGRYLARTKDKGIIYEPDISMGIKCCIDVDFAGGWNITTSADADDLMSRTGFVITYANCPIYWVSCLQTDIVLSTAKAEYITMSSALRKVIPLMTLMKELHTIFPVHINKPNFSCNVHEDNQSTIKMATSGKLTPQIKHIALKTPFLQSCQK
jgi:hypothetical protein